MSYSPTQLIAPCFLRAGEDRVVSANERTLLRLVWRNRGISRSEVTAHVDLTQQSVYRIVDHLVERGMVALAAPKLGHGRGQPSPTLQLDGGFAYCCGISVNTDVIGLCLIDFAGLVLAEAQIPLRDHDMSQALELVAKELKAQQDAQLLSSENLFGIGFAIAGYHVGGTRYNAPLPLHEWSLIELGPKLSEFFGKPVWVHNGANTGAIAEAMFGIGRYIRHFAYLSFNYGFGGGLISDGELLVGGNGNAGEFSGIYDEHESPRRPALQYLIQRLAKNGVEFGSISDMRQNFDPEWPGVSEWVDEVTPAYNRLVNAICSIFDPQAIVLGGQIPSTLAHMLIERTRIFGRPRYGVPHPAAKMIVSDIEGDASALGASVFPFRAEIY